jgi:hypothetical protein
MGADQGGYLGSGRFYSLCKLVNRTAHFTGLCLCSRLYLGGGTGNSPRTYPDGRPFERVGERRDCSRLTRAHALEQQFRLAVEQLKDFPFEASIAERHAREMIAVEHRCIQRFVLRALIYVDRDLRHLGLPAVFIGEEFDPIGIKSR